MMPTDMPTEPTRFQAEQSQQTIAVTATFTAEQIAAPLAFWMQELNLPSAIEFTDYNQVFQQLLDPASLLRTNSDGVNIILVRFEDWQRSGPKTEIDGDNLSNFYEKIERNVQDLLVALKSAASCSKTPYLICICPPSPSIASDPRLASFLQQMESLIVSEVEAMTTIHFTTDTQLKSVYPVDHYYNAYTDELGHIPYTPMFFCALGSFLARKIYAIRNTPYKVIVLDCDNTIWKGVVGEDGVMGIELASPWEELQQFMLTQQKAGKLLCLCSKNNEPDVLEVFEQRPEMPLKLNQIVSYRINWLPKSENIKSLAQELNLGLDSFIFIDDNPVECAEVQANCPEVLTIQLPINKDIPQFLKHIWAFDLLKATEEDKQRTLLYQQNIKRHLFRQEVLTIDDFLVGLELQINISESAPHQWLRVAQLTQRTNQFNFTTIRRSESEIQQLPEIGMECRVVEVSDRFGDYGLAGVMIFSMDQSCLKVDSFLLSCRVLGRGVEHKMFNYLARVAEERQLAWIHVFYRKTKKNLPALNFLESIVGDFKQPLEGGYQFSVPVAAAIAVSYAPGAPQSALDTNESTQPSIVTKAPTFPFNKSKQLSHIATHLCTAAQILQAIEANQRSRRSQLERKVFVPQTETEQRLAQIWSQLLYTDSISLQDNFFDLGGTSLLAVQLFAQIKQVFGKDLSIATLLDAPTLQKLADLLQDKQVKGSWSSLVLIQPQGSQTPLFCVHALGGNVLIYRRLASYLGIDRPVYGLQSRGLDGQHPPLKRVEDMATCYLAEIRAVQPDGPYYLAGYSLGGLIAFEMAQQLHRQGVQVGLVSLIDTYARDLVVDIREHTRRTFSEKLVLHLSHLLGSSSKDYLDYLLGQVISKVQTVLIEQIYLRFQLPLPYQLRLKAVKAANQQASVDYKSEVYTGGKVALLRATELSDYPDLGWSGLVRGQLEIQDVPGKHNEVDAEGLLTEPHVQVTAKKLKACLESASDLVSY